jgi:hypothetical protein
VPETAPSSEISPVIRQTSPRSWALTPASADQQQQRVTTASVSSRRRVSSSIGALALRWPRWHRRSILAEQQHARRRLRSSFGGAARTTPVCGAARTGRHVRDAFKRAGVDPSRPAGTGELCFLLICKENFSPIGDGTSSSVSRVGTVVSTRRFAEMLSMLAIHRSAATSVSSGSVSSDSVSRLLGATSVSRAQSAELSQQNPSQQNSASTHAIHISFYIRRNGTPRPPASPTHTLPKAGTCVCEGEIARARVLSSLSPSAPVRRARARVGLNLAVRGLAAELTPRPPCVVRARAGSCQRAF